MSRDRRVVEEIYAALDIEAAAAGRLDGLFETHMTPDFVLHPPPIYVDVGKYSGIGEVKDFLRMLAEVWDEWRFEYGEIQEAGEGLLVQVTLVARGRGSGAVTNAPAWHVWRLSDGKAASVKTYLQADEARADLQSPAMIDRDQVLHVARLARLRLSDEEVERMAGELSTILEHIERIDELDLEGVEPTSHVVELENVLREDEPRPSLPRERALEQAPGRGRRRLPGAEPGARERGAARADRAPQAAERCARASCPAAELFDFYRERAAGDDLNAFLWVADEAPDAPADAPLGGVPLAVKDLFCVEGVPSAAGSRILEGYRPPYTATAVREPPGRRRAGARQDQPGRVRDGLVERELGLRAGAEPVGPRRACRAARAAARAAAVAAGLAPWAIGTDTGGSIRQPAVALRDRRAQAHLRRRLALRDDRLRLVARPVRPAHARRDRRRAAVPPHGRPRPLRLDLARASPRR